MSRFLDVGVASLVPYVPGEQPKDAGYIKLNTNESPYPPSPSVIAAVKAESEKLRLYSDPETSDLTAAIAEFYGVGQNNVIAGNGSDEILAFIFKAFFGEKGAACPDVSYGFYPVFCSLFGIKYNPVPLDENFMIDASAYADVTDNVVIANPNAQTGIYLPLDKVEEIARSRPDRLVVVDEAYVDFGGETAVPLTKKYNNLIVVQTFSKSRQLAGGRVGFAVADESLINDIKTVKYSFNPYNVGRLGIAAGCAAMKDREYFDACRSKIIATRGRVAYELAKLGFTVLPSKANFLLIRHGGVGGEEMYRALKQRGVLVRHLKDERIKDFVRVTIGTDDEMDVFLKKTAEILGELK